MAHWSDGEPAEQLAEIRQPGQNEQLADAPDTPVADNRQPSRRRSPRSSVALKYSSDFF
jgi:hypothetical protein